MGTNLISAGDNADFLAAMSDVFATFNMDNIVYNYEGKAGFDIFQEDRPNQIVNTTLACRVQILSEKQVNELPDGDIGYEYISVMFDGQYLAGLSAVWDRVNNKPIFDNTVDYLQWRGKLYKVMVIHNDDSDFQGTTVLYKVICRSKELKA